MLRISCTQTGKRVSITETEDIVPNQQQCDGTCPQELSQQNNLFPRRLKLVPLSD